ncbi:T9SS type A sorting domain-containing protein [Ferruginibacter paludis]|uniref:T9SS type A sorting domain-containing protein n=1 Tax=Ferruginibacter paludis TaxID=1310417 RepID=UPI0025B2D5C6|nr:T9SS type A sorting domain-containing protein [Ferruginibacter paludis]MDN3654971.1 T9SS type A sorting domain-containing protein [Ferruginibacter paludis]
MKKYFLLVLVIAGLLQSVKSQCPSGAGAFLNADPNCPKGCGVLLYNWPEGVTVYIFRATPVKVIDSVKIPGAYGGPGRGSAYLCVNCSIPLIFASITPNAGNGCVIIGGFTTPVKLTDLSLATNGSNSCQVKWTTYSENPGTIFTIQRSSNSYDFKDIALVAGYGKASNKYTYTDNNIEAGPQYFRIKITEPSGKISYSEIALIKNQGTFGASIYPNPTDGDFKITIPSQFLPAKIMIYNAEGKAVHDAFTFQSSISVIRRFTKGIYAVRITGSNNASITQTLLIK